ncbi:MAG: hypothetical protein CFE21_03480 [Bacteroidetes bacterium B1(2017)]|nr:MAG: hypothetical protein CFE21_03480 [Bacteroidetes bacterium B1(2017)]
MKNFKFYLLLTLAITAMALALQSCKKGSDDPAVSVYSRKDRFTNTWTLTKYEKNGAVQDLSGTTYQYSVFNTGNLTQTIEGTIFGFPTRSVKDGTWSFQNDDEDVKITIGSDATVYNIQRLASKELWLRKTIDADTYVYYFTGL